MTKAALYLRSSKDRSDVSIAAQRRELQSLASDRGLTIVAEYSDAVESAKDEHRPGFQKLLTDLREPTRGWSALLMVDTSRLSRRRFSAQVFKHEASKRGVAIIYSKVPDADPITNVLIQSVLEAMDEIHSLMSKEKGLAGMRENVARGFRAGGRAPYGYQLERVPTGVVRDGQEVTKSRLVLDKSTAPKIARYLKARAAGAPRAAACEASGVELTATTLIGIEHNALTYAGHTVWNQHAEHGPGGYKGGVKRRPRSEWVMQRDTHPALISDDEAEQLVSALAARTSGRSRASEHLLGGLLRAPDGRAWHGEGARYRLRGKARTSESVPAAELDAAVLEHVRRDLDSPRFLKALVTNARAQHRKAGPDPTRPLRRELAAIADRIQTMLSFASKLEDPAPALREVERLERERKRMEYEIGILEREQRTTAALANIDEAVVREVVAALREGLEEEDRQRVKARLVELVERIEMQPGSEQIRLCYRIRAGDKMASPRESELIPTLRAVRIGRV